MYFILKFKIFCIWVGTFLVAKFLALLDSFLMLFFRLTLLSSNMTAQTTLMIAHLKNKQKLFYQLGPFGSSWSSSRDVHESVPFQCNCPRGAQ